MDELKMFDIIYVDFSDNKIGSEQSGIHPYIIIQNNIGNKHCPTVLGMSLTKMCEKLTPLGVGWIAQKNKTMCM